MKRILIFSLAAVSVALLSSCGSDILKSVTGDKKDTKVQFYNDSWYNDGTAWNAELRIMNAVMRASTGAWSNAAKVDDCKHDTARTATLFDGPWPVYVFTNIPLECEENNLYTIRVTGLHHYIEWGKGSLH